MNVVFNGTIPGTTTEVAVNRQSDGTAGVNVDIEGGAHLDGDGTFHYNQGDHVALFLTAADAVRLAVAIASADVGWRHEIARELGYMDQDEREDTEGLVRGGRGLSLEAVFGD